MNGLRVALCVDSLDEGEDLMAARGLGRALADRGHEVEVVPRSRWHLVSAADLFAGLRPDVDPSLAPPGAWTVAWVHDHPRHWAARRTLVAWDQVLAASEATLTLLRRGTPRADGVLPLAADTERPGAEEEVGDPVAVPRDPVVLALGLVPGGFFEHAAHGRLPILRGSLGLHELGLDTAPTYVDRNDLADRVAEAQHDSGSVRARSLQQQVHEDHGWAHRAVRFEELVENARRERGPSPLRTPVHFAPDFSAGNPFQSMLYTALPDLGAHASPVADVVEHLERRAERVGDPGVLHLHWTSPILQWAATADQAQHALDRFREALTAFRRRGGRLVWTVHNVLPHDEQHRDQEIELARCLAGQADLVHLLSQETLSEVGGLYELDPAKVAVIEHSSYLGQYPDWVTPEAARSRLGLLPAEKVLLALGGIRPYKGLDLLVDAFEQLVDVDPTLRLLVAGKASEHPAIEQLRERCERHPRILSHFAQVPDDQLQVWLRAADIVVLPYRRILNSGSYLLAQTFGRPVVAPRDGALRAEDGRAHVRLFEPGDPSSLRQVLAGAVDDLVTDDDGARSAAASSSEGARRRPPEEMAAAFTSAVQPMLG